MRYPADIPPQKGSEERRAPLAGPFTVRQISGIRKIPSEAGASEPQSRHGGKQIRHIRAFSVGAREPPFAPHWDGGENQERPDGVSECGYAVDHAESPWPPVTPPKGDE